LVPWESIIVALAAFATFALAIIAAITAVNIFTFPRLDRERPGPTMPEQPPVSVSVLIPARNEAAVIGESVRQHVRQDYADFEVIILDDNSTDATAELARRAAGAAADGSRSSARLRVVPGKPLPEGWSGKNWACHQLSQVATGQILVFTDADVIWTPGALSRLVAEMAGQRSDLQTVWPTQITESWTERLVVPLMAFVIVGYLPLLAVHHLPWPIFAAAMGQCLAFRRKAYAATGGHAALRSEIVEDVAFAKQIKRAGLRLRVADGGGVICCRMYRNWREVSNGFAKNILAGHGDSIPFLLLSWAFHWLLWLAPWLWLVAGIRVETPGWPLWPALLIVLGVGIRALTAAFSLQRVHDAVWMPVSVLLMAIIAGRSIWWRLRYGGPRWRGRTLSKVSRTKGEAHDNP
jgi:chlorobactene glucosyltransferase